jgi:hypothetical protein
LLLQGGQPGQGAPPAVRKAAARSPEIASRLTHAAPRISVAAATHRTAIVMAGLRQRLSAARAYASVHVTSAGALAEL